MDLAFFMTSAQSDSISVKESAVFESESVFSRRGISVENSSKIFSSEAVVFSGDFKKEFSGVHRL